MVVVAAEGPLLVVAEAIMDVASCCSTTSTSDRDDPPDPPRPSLHLLMALHPPSRVPHQCQISHISLQ